MARKPDSGPTHRNIIPVISGLLLHSSAMILVPFGAFGAIVYDWADRERASKISWFELSRSKRGGGNPYRASVPTVLLGRSSVCHDHGDT